MRRTPLYPVNSKLIGVPMVAERGRERKLFVTDNWRRLQKHIELQRKAGGFVRCEYRELETPYEPKYGPACTVVEVADVIFSKQEN